MVQLVKIVVQLNKCLLISTQCFPGNNSHMLNAGVNAPDNFKRGSMITRLLGVNTQHKSKQSTETGQTKPPGATIGKISVDIWLREAVQ